MEEERIMKTIGSLDVLVALIKSQGKKTVLWEDGTSFESNNILGEEGASADPVQGSAKKTILGSTNYILNQLIRNIWIPKERQLVSKKAHEKWIALGLKDEDIRDYYYKMPVRNKKECSATFFKGSSSTGVDITLKVGSKFDFRSVFHEDHIVTIKDIIDVLTKLEFTEDTQENYDKVKDVLSRIYTCRMLKGEDRRLNKISKNSRGTTNYKEVIENVYKKAGVEIDDSYAVGK